MSGFRWWHVICFGKTYDTSEEERWRHRRNKSRDLDPTVLEPPMKPDGIVAIRGDSKTVVDWTSGHTHQKNEH